MMADDPKSLIILVCGIPCSGKSKYGEWLEREKGFVHLDVEKSGVLDRAGLETLWNFMFAPGSSVAPFVGALRRRKWPVVIDWGFPPRWLSVVCALQRAGVEIWWFDGDREAARQCFIRRAEVEEKLTGRLLEERIEQFKRQTSMIAKEWSKISVVVGPHLVDTIKPDGQCMPEQEIFERMFGPDATTMSTAST